jgi:hypothetical protein
MVPNRVAHRAIRAIVRLAIDLDDQPSRRAIEIENIRRQRMLSAKP